MVNIIYIHGLYSSPKKEKLAILEAFSDKLYAPQLDYEQNQSIFPELLSACVAQDIHYIVGSSAGGLMGYWLAKHLGCQALLFNPALNSLHRRPDIELLKEKAPTATDYFLNVILGAKDEQVPPLETQTYLKAHELESRYLIDWQPKLAHSIDLETFRMACEKYLPNTAKV